MLFLRVLCPACFGVVIKCYFDPGAGAGRDLQPTAQVFSQSPDEAHAQGRVLIDVEAVA